MRIEFQDSFVERLEQQVEYIARDKPRAARKFKSDLLRELKKLKEFPFHCKPSRYFQSGTVRDMVFKGYTVTYKVDEAKGLVSVFGLVKHQQNID